jgi:transposase
MKSTSSSHATDWREGRRLRAWELHQAGWSQQQIADALGVTQGAISKWLTRARQGGIAALYRRKAAGRSAQLTPEQRAQLPALLNHGAQAFGFRGAVWTRARVALVIKRTFGITYHPAHVGRILKAVRWSCQQPTRRARQRNDAAIQHWRDQDAPALKKKP